MHDIARFQEQKVHALKWTSDDAARSYCGLWERREIWAAPDGAPLCGACARYLGEHTDTDLGRSHA